MMLGSEAAGATEAFLFWITPEAVSNLIFALKSSARLFRVRSSSSCHAVCMRSLSSSL